MCTSMMKHKISLCTTTGLEGPAFQHSRVATSKNGIDFTAREENLGRSYFRTFNYNEMTYALAMPGQFYRSKMDLQTSRKDRASLVQT